MLKLQSNPNRVATPRVMRVLLASVIGFQCIGQRAARAQASPATVLVKGSVQSDEQPAEASPFLERGSVDLQSSEQDSSAKPASSQQPAPSAPATLPATPSQAASGTIPNPPDAPKPVPKDPASQFAASVCTKLPCPTPIINWYMRFENGPQVKPLTPTEKAWLATKNLIDPFNMLTILGEAGISVAADSHSPYGPGFPGWGRYVGVSFTQDMTGEFFNTFLIPSIVHQDPHYHRMPHATYVHRVFHAIDQVVWTQGDNGKGMVNYANIVGYAIDDEISNLYVPGRQTNFNASAERYGIGLATAPIDNFISEFLPDVARHIHVQVVVIQRIINQVASKDANTP